MKNILLLSIAICSAVSAFAQSTDQKVTALLNNHIITQNKYSAIKEGMKGAYIAVDPITYYEEIRYREGVDSSKIAAFEKYSREEQLQILQSEPIVMGDTLTILDSAGFFKQRMYTFSKHPQIKVVSKADNPYNDYMYVSKIPFKGTDILVFLYIDGIGAIYNYSLKMDEQPLALMQVPVR